MQDEKIKKSLIIESRLKLLLLALQYKDSDIVEVIISKVLEQNDLDKEIMDIITNIEFNLRFNQFEHSINEINDYLHKKPTTIVKYEDKELKELKQELTKLEIKFQELIEEKTEYLNDIEEFNTQYSLHLGELIKTILNLKKEILYKKTIKNQKLKKQYKANKDICDETKQTIDELKNTVSEFEEILENIDKDDENYEEISSAYNEIKEELEKLEDELILQEEKLEKTEKELKENEIFEEEYENAKATYEQFDDEYEHIKDTQKDVIKLDEKQQKELKILFKKAAKLCHPDIVADELKEKAHEIMQSLNDAYSKKDIEQVKKILLSLESGTTFKTVSSDIEDKELLLNKIKEFEQNISDLEEEIEHIKLDDTFTTISQLDNWDEYFEELKNELTEQKTNLEKEAMEVLAEKEEIEEWIQKLWDWADENNISSGKLSRKKENLLAMTTIDFTGLKLKNICKEIFNLKNVTTFSLWDNDISFLPNEIVNFTNLKKLNLRGNPNLAISPNQKEWIEALRGKCSVFIDSVKYLEEETLVKREEKNSFEQINQEIIRINDIDKEELIKFIKNWIVNKVVSLNNINISNIVNDIVALQRIRYASNAVYDDLLKNNISNVNLPFITKDLNGSPINFLKENITFESLEFKKDINTKSENKLEDFANKNEESIKLNEIDKDELIKFIKNWIISQISEQQYNIDIINDVVALQRISYASNDVYVDLLNNNESSVNLPFITKDLNGRPINFIKENITFESLKFKTENKLIPEKNTPKKFSNKIFAENSDYSKHIHSIENIKFEKIRKYCENLSKDNSTDDMQKYLAQNGKMYKALIYDAFEQFISKLDNQTITLIDWGSNQGIASMVVLDYIKEKQLDIKVSQVILVDDDTKILSRAMAQVEALSQDNIQIIAIKNDDDNLLDKIKTNTIALNLFANDRIPIDFKVINDVIYKDFIMCLSNENIEFVDNIYNDFNNSTNIQDLSIRDGNIGRYQRYERIFKLIN